MPCRLAQVIPQVGCQVAFHYTDDTLIQDERGGSVLNNL